MFHTSLQRTCGAVNRVLRIFGFTVWVVRVRAHFLAFRNFNAKPDLLVLGEYWVLVVNEAIL